MSSSLPKVLTHSQFVALVSAATIGATFVSFIAETEADLKKTGNPFGTVIKRSAVNGCVGFDYEKSVNRQQGREGGAEDFVAEPRNWGTRISRFFVEHTPKGADRKRTYLTVKVEKVLEKPEYLRADTMEPLAKELIAPFLPKSRSNADHQGVTKEIIYRDYALDSIRHLRYNGENIDLRPDPV